MTIGFRAASNSAAAASATATPISPPAGLTSTDLSILAVEAKQTVAGTPPTCGTPAGWTEIGTVQNTGNDLASSQDGGTTFVWLFYRVGTYTGTITLSLTGTGSTGAGITALTTSAGTWDTAALADVAGADATSGANGSITATASLALNTDDWVLAAVGHPGDVGTMSAQTIGGTGIGATTRRIELLVTTGTDSRLSTLTAPVTAGGTVIPTYAWTNASNLTGIARFLRVRESGGTPPAATPMRRVGKWVY